MPRDGIISVKVRGQSPPSKASSSYYPLLRGSGGALEAGQGDAFTSTNIISELGGTNKNTEIKLENKSVVGAGSVITKNVKSKSLALTRTEQKEVKDYKRKKKK